jgi:rod shape-determining protein MreD
MAIGLTLLIILTELIHSAWLVRLPIFGQVIDPSLPLIIAVGFARPSWAPLAGLGAGLLQDLLFGGSLGLFALSKFLVGQGAGALGRVLVEQRTLPWLVTAGATVAHQVILAVVLIVTGLLPVTAADFGRPLLAQVLANLIAVLPVFTGARALFRARRALRGREGLHGI